MRRSPAGRAANDVPAWSRWLVAAALLGGLALLLRSGALSLAPSSPAPTSVPASSGQRAAYDGDALALDTPLLAGDQPRSVQHGSRARWELAPGSRARLLSSGSVLRVALESGSLEAYVMPSAQPESFVVQASGTEVAVHGTRFRVSSSGEQAHVEVLQGVVHVRPIGLSTGTVLSAGMQADFLAGAVLPAPASPGARAALPPEAASGAGRAPPLPAAPLAKPSPLPARSVLPPGRELASTAPPSAATPPSVAPPSAAIAARAPDAAGERALQRASEHVRSCFRRHLRGSRDLDIEVSTRLGLWVEANGQLLHADFEPPLAPAIEACVAEKLAQFQAAPSPEGYRVERDLVLHR